MINFQRNKEVKSAISIGLVSKRVFKDVAEAAVWASQFPAAYTDGFIQSWWDKNPHNDLPFFDFNRGRMDTEATKNSPEHYTKLHIVKWIKNNIRFEGSEDYKIGLKDAKQIIDRAEEIIQTKYHMKKYGLIPNDLEKADQFVDDILEVAKREENGMDHFLGFCSACQQMKIFIKTLRNEN